MDVSYNILLFSLESKFKMRISQRIVWIFSMSYILREGSFLCSKPKFLLHGPIIFIFGLLRVLQLYFLQKSKKQNSINIPDHIVVKSAAPHMHVNYFRLFNPGDDSSKYIYIECFNKNQFTQIRRLHFWDIFFEFYLTFKELIPVLSKLQAEQGKKNLMRQAMLSLPVFAYFVCLFKNLKNENSNIKIFSGGVHLISASAITAEIPAYWLSHGLLAQAKLNEKNIEHDPSKYFIALPDYDYIYLFSKDEQNYLSDHNVRSFTKLYEFTKIGDLKNKILIFLIDSPHLMNVQDLKETIDLFQRYDYEVILKFHPSHKSSFSLEFVDNKNIKIDESLTASASDLMKAERPKYVASWGSTTLCEALRQGIAPICLCSNGEEKFQPYLHRKRSIWWHDDQAMLLKFLNDLEGNSLKIFVDGINKF